MARKKKIKVEHLKNGAKRYTIISTDGSRNMVCNTPAQAAYYGRRICIETGDCVYVYRMTRVYRPATEVQDVE